MISYLFIQSLFTNVLAKSKVMQGRFHTCPKYGQEMNSDQFDEVIKDIVKPGTPLQYPCTLMMPPQSEMTLKDDQGEWERYRIELYFLCTTYTTGNNQIKQANKKTNTSTHTVVEDWHDMKRCAKDFVLMLTKIAEGKTPGEYPFRLVDHEKKLFDPVSFQGTNKLSGVRLTFKVDAWAACEAIEDYEADSWLDITIPDVNAHPTHLH